MIARPHRPIFHQIHGLLLPALLGVALSAQAADAPFWPQNDSDLKPDPKAEFGALENGLRYVILPNSEPPGRASLRLYMDAGSLMEEDDQQGMAHFLEHMAFNGTRHFPSGEMVEYFQRLGMAFGADTNAHTSFNETVYKLELPKVDAALLGDAVKLFRDYLDGMLLKAEEIDRERGIILSEKLSRDSIDYRTMVAGYQFALPDSLLPHRLPIGLEKTIQSMPRARFEDFYRKWYTPHRATVVAVGDFPDLALVKKLIADQFGDAQPPTGDHPDPSLGKIDANRGLIAMLHTEMEAKQVDLSLEVVTQAKAQPDNSEVRRERLIRSLADAMLNQRFSKLSKAPDSPINSASSYSYEYLDFVATSGVGASCDPSKWQAALSLIEQELRRAIEYGFSAAEFEEARATVLQQLRLKASQADTRRSRDLADGLVNQLSSRKVFTAPADDLARVQPILETLTAEEALAALKKDWATEDRQIFVGGNLALEGDAAAQIKATYTRSLAEPVDAPAQEEVAAFAYTDFGPEGKVTNQTEVEDLEITQATFANGVQVSLKPTPFEKGTVRVTVRFGAGKLTAPEDQPGLIPFAQSTFELGGLEAHDVDTLRRLFAGKTVSSDFVIEDGAFLLGGRTTPGDLLAQLQLLAAYVTAPGYRTEARDQFVKNLEPLYVQLQHTAEGVMMNRVVHYLHNDDARFGYPPIDVMRQRTLDEVRAWMQPMLKSSFMEIGIVGDFEPEAALKALAATFGALPQRETQKPAYTAERAVTLPAAPASQNFDFTTEIPKAIAAIYWPTADMNDIQRTRRLSLLGSILDDRLRIKVREELGETYSPACYHNPSDTFTGYGYMTAMIEVKPEQLDSITQIVTQIAAEVAVGPITQDEFERAKAPQMSQIEQMRRDNRYWSQNVVKSCQENPQRLEWARTILSDCEAIKLEEVQALAKEYLTPDRVVSALIRPQTVPEDAKGQ
ncbi:MAG: insulinase family protein [Verrucomicrobiales bacterium]|nr:insulinase family protein [Verrucomicrobiales bacterium]